MGDVKKIHCCPYQDCNSKFNRPYRLNQHLLTHENIKPYPCKEKGCSKSYSSKSHLDRHVSAAHAKNDNTEAEIVYSCPTCMKKYVNRQNLKRHMKTGHNLKDVFSCDTCKFEFKKKHHLSAHMYNHTGIKAFSCDICEAEFVTLYDKRRHMRRHKTYECSKCLCCFKQWSRYQKHLKTEHVVHEYICDTCGRVFRIRNHLIRHLKCHDFKAYQCTFENCKRYYSRKSNLRQHILVKHENLTHDCTICGAKLSTKRKLLDHIQIRHVSKPKTRKPKTKATGRKTRKDAGILRKSTACKLAGLPEKSNDKIQESGNLIQANVT